MISLSVGWIWWITTNINVIEIGRFLCPLKTFSNCGNWVRIIAQHIVAQSPFEIIWRRIVFWVYIESGCCTLFYRIAALNLNRNLVLGVWSIHCETLIRLVIRNPVRQLKVIIINLRVCEPWIQILFHLPSIITTSTATCAVLKVRVHISYHS